MDVGGVDDAVVSMVLACCQCTPLRTRLGSKNRLFRFTHQACGRFAYSGFCCSGVPVAVHGTMVPG